MYIVHIPEQPEIEPKLRSTLYAAENLRDEMNREAGSQSAVIDLIHTTIRFTDKRKQDE
jgi:hypothetical protein